MKVLTFGEIMLRLKAPGQERFFQTPMLEATFGGGEANVAVSLANYGMDVSYLTVLPKNAIADECVKELRKFGVDTSRIVRGGGRMGIYYLEPGANQLPSKVVYDREYSSIALAKPGDIDWDKVANRTVYIGPDAYSLYSTSFGVLQGMAADGNEAPIRFEIFYNLIK